MLEHEGGYDILELRVVHEPLGKGSVYIKPVKKEIIYLFHEDEAEVVHRIYGGGIPDLLVSHGVFLDGIKEQFIGGSEIRFELFVQHLDDLGEFFYWRLPLTGADRVGPIDRGGLLREGNRSFGDELKTVILQRDIAFKINDGVLVSLGELEL